MQKGYYVSDGGLFQELHREYLEYFSENFSGVIFPRLIEDG